MKQLLQRLVTLNRRYDQMEEPQRYFLAMALMMPGFMLIAFNPAYHPALFYGGALYLSTMLGLRVLGMRLMKT